MQTPVIKAKLLSVFALVMINVIAVDSLRTLTIGAQYGFTIIFYYLLGGLFFLIPIALAAAELATGWPKAGGIYIWLREAFGKRWGLLIMWLQWLYNVFWYPTIMAFIASALAYIIEPSLADNKTYLWSMMIVLFWAATLVNWFGMNFASWVSTVGALCGTLLPMGVIILLALVWMLQGKPVNVDFSWQGFLPQLNHPHNLALLTLVLFGLVGLEMSAVHAAEVRNPQRDYPRALLISCLLILSTLMLGSLAVAIVIPQAQIQLASGLMQGFKIFFTVYGLGWMTPIMALLIVLGSFSAVSAWIIGPTKGLMIAAADGSAPLFMATQNRYGMPSYLLLAQGFIFVLLSTLFIFMPSINSAFTLLSTITAQLAILVYGLIFAALLRLRYTQPNVARHYKIPGGMLGVWLVAGCGFCMGAVVLVLGFLPPSQIPLGNVTIYESLLIGGIVVACLPPFLMPCQQPSQSRDRNQNVSTIRQK